MMKYLRRGLRFKPIHFNNNLFCTSNGRISSMDEVQSANKFYEERNIEPAISLLERSLSILPLEGDEDYNREYEEILGKLANCYAWKGSIHLIAPLIQSRQLHEGSIRSVSDALVVVGKKASAIYNVENTEIKENFSRIKEIYGQSINKAIQQLTRTNQQKTVDTTNLQHWIHSGIRPNYAFIITSLIKQHTITSNPLYNKLCNTLLHNTQKSSQKNIVKALIVLITNLIRNQQYLKAEGMIEYCLSRKRQNLKPELLVTNQEYILLNLLLAKTFSSVNRTEESNRLISQYSELFNLQTFIIQAYLVDSI